MTKMISDNNYVSIFLVRVD